MLTPTVLRSTRRFFLIFFRWAVRHRMQQTMPPTLFRGRGRCSHSLKKKRYVEPAWFDVAVFFPLQVKATMELSVDVFGIAGVFLLRCALLGTTLVGTGRLTTPRHAKLKAKIHFAREWLHRASCFLLSVPPVESPRGLRPRLFS